MQQAEDRVETGLNRIRAGIVAPHQEELDRLAAAPQELVEQRNAEVKAFVAERVDALNARIRELAEGPVESMNERLADVQEQANSIDDEIRELFAPRIAPLNEVIEGVRQDAEALDAEVRRVGAEGIAEINAAIREINERYETQLSDVTDRVEEIQREIHDDLENATSSALDGIEWPQPEEEDASAEPLFDSTRTYLEQMNVYKRHQGRATARKINRNRGQPWSSKRRAADKRVLKPRGGQP